MSTQWHGGKGSSRRPMSVDEDTYASNWDRIFNNKKKEQLDDIKSSEEIADKDHDYKEEL
jgi:hypothetical protein